VPSSRPPLSSPPRACPATRPPALRQLGRRGLLAASCAWLAPTGAPALAATCPALPAAPVIAQHPVRIRQFGHERTDPYAWLHPPGWFSDLHHPERLAPAIRAVLEAENRYLDAVMRPTAALQAELRREMGERVPQGAPPPEPDGAWEYWSEIRPGAQQPRYLRRPRGGGPTQVLADFDRLARGHAYFRLSSLKAPSHSPDGRLFGWAVDETGDENFRIYVRDIATGRLVGPPIEHGFGEWMFSPDGQWLFWLLRDADSHPTKVFRRPARWGADRPPADMLVYQERDPAFFVSLSRAASGGALFITAFNATASEVWVIPGEQPTASPRVAQRRAPGLQYELEHWFGTRFVVRTNEGGATDYKLMLADAPDLSRGGWRPWIATVPGRPITAMRAYSRHFARVEWRDALPVLVSTDRAGGGERSAAGADPAYALTLDTDSEYDSPRARYGWQSPRRPVEWWTLDMASGARSCLGRQRVAQVEPDAYEVRRLSAPSSDGVQVPITLLMRRGTRLDGRASLILFAYGAYGFSLPADFSAARLSLADRGWMVAIAHVRGGAERGFGWFEQTLKAGKRRSVDDFIACASHLARAGYTGPGRIVAHSYSAGGIVIGSAINRRPGLFAGCIGEVPFVDVLNTMDDASNPLVPSARPIWGDPVRDRASYDAIAGYAPYETIRRQPYPAVLATAGLLDDRVGFWEPAKWVARLRACSTSGKPVMLHTDMTAGHQGAAGVDDTLARDALSWAFAIRSVSGCWGGS